ncbi:MAG: DUF4928 family protein [Burkholderiaceae bacterium]|jgi:hypothetical protein|nr:DUF4928 family protein [Burkholderiaceae bacterium]
MAKAPRTPPVSGLLPGLLPEPDLASVLLTYKSSSGLIGKGQIATMIYASRLARRSGLPFNVEEGITTEGEGQVKGLGKGSVQAILMDYGITRVLAEEGGRTSRGSLGNIRSFLNFLNDLHTAGKVDTSAIEAWWVKQASHFFNAKPFALRFETGKSLRSVVRDLLAQARKRQDEGAGTMFVGAMLQHLIGAKLSLALPNTVIKHNGFSVADGPTGRSGDFEIGNASLHITTTPGEAVIRKCAANLSAGRHPIVITVHEMLPAADAFATAQGIADKLDVLDAEQFLVANLYELGGFRSDQRRVTIEALVDKYNEIVTAQETDPSLRISRD